MNLKIYEQTCLYIQLLVKVLKVVVSTIETWTEIDTIKHLERGGRNINIARAPGTNCSEVLQHVWYRQEWSWTYRRTNRAVQPNSSASRRVPVIIFNLPDTTLQSREYTCWTLLIYPYICCEILNNSNSWPSSICLTFKTYSPLSYNGRK